MSKENIICGRKVVREVINSSINIDKFYISRNVNKESIQDILDYAQKNNIDIKFVYSSDLDRICNDNIHQGIAGKISNYKFLKFNDFLECCKGKKNPIVLILENIQDPRNLGSILRTAEGMGVSDIIIPQKKSCGITDTVWKTSMGALAHLNICRFNNISYCAEEFKKNGFKVIATSLDTQNNLSDIEYDYPMVLIIGNEKDGVSDEMLKLCDIKIKIPMCGKVNSFNVSVATGIVLYEIKNIQSRY